MVGRQVLVLEAGVRIPVPEPERDAKRIYMSRKKLNKTSDLPYKVQKANTREEKLLLLSKYFKEKKFKIGSIFLPNDGFYSWDATGDSLRRMAAEIFNYLGWIPTNFIVDFIDIADENCPGFYVPPWNTDGVAEGIYINSKHCNSPFQCAAVLAHEGMHFYLMRVCGVVLDDNQQNELFTDLGTIYAGLGTLIINSFGHQSSWHWTIILFFLGFLYRKSNKLSFGYYGPNEYAEIFQKFLDKNEISYSSVYGHVLQNSRYFLPVQMKLRAKTRRVVKEEYVKLSEKKALKTNLTRISIVAGFILFLIISNTGSQDSDGKTQCLNGLGGIKSQIETMESQMESLKSKNSITEYNNLVAPHNNLVNDYNTKKQECDNK